MDNLATTSSGEDDLAAGQETGPDKRAAPRFTLLIRAAKMIADQGEFVCVIRDVSETGVSVRLFHQLPASKAFELELPTGAQYAMRNVWQRGNEAGFEFLEPVSVARLIAESGEYPKRGLRLGLCFPVAVNTLTQRSEAIVENLSQQGARFSCDALLAIDQNLRIDGGELSDVRAKVRWRRDENYGVVFDDTFTLGDFARIAARLQAPALVED
ncbi:MAG: PilZ domain-containing protein [Erythrobacter sp.]|nr:PilZ domain-containing protein [Erythrobacter sp.]